MTTQKSQCEELLDVVMPFAEKMLAAHGEFYPFGASMNSVGDIRQVAAYDGREVPPPQPLIDLLRDGFRADAATGAIIASAIAYDVRTIPPGTRTKVDAVAVQLDHRDNYSVVALFPYTVKRGVVTVGESFARNGDHYVFRGHGS